MNDRNTCDNCGTRIRGTNNGDHCRHCQQQDLDDDDDGGSDDTSAKPSSAISLVDTDDDDESLADVCVDILDGVDVKDVTSLSMAMNGSMAGSVPTGQVPTTSFDVEVGFVTVGGHEITLEIERVDKETAQRLREAYDS